MARQLCTTFVFTSFLALTGGMAQAQGYVEALKAHLQTDQSPLLAAATFEDMTVTPIDGGSRIELISVAYAGQALDSLGFDLTELEGTLVRLTNVDMPSSMSFATSTGSQTVSWDTLTATGIYDTATGGYETLDLQGQGLSLTSDNQSLDMRFDSLETTSTFLPADGSFSGEIRGSGMTLTIEDADLQMAVDLPSGWMRTKAQGYGADQNPLLTLGNQVLMTLQPLFDPEAQTAVVEALPYAQSYTQTASFAPATLAFTQIDTATVSLGTTSLSASFNDMNVPKGATGQISYFIDGVQVLDPTSETNISLQSLGLTIALENGDYTNGASLNSHRLYSETPGTYAPIADVVEAAGKARAQFIARGIAVSAPNDAMNFGAERLDLTFGIDTRTADGSFGVGTLIEGLKVEGFGGEFIAGLMPQQLAFTLDMSSLDMPALAEIMRAAVRSGSIADARVTDVDVEAMMPALLDWWLGTGAQLEPNLTLEAALTSLSLSGTLPFDAEAAYGLTGDMDIVIAEYDAFVERVNEAVGSDNLEDQQISLTLAQGLGFLGIFGEKLEDGSLKLAVSVDPSGMISVNGIPLPF